MKLKKLDEMYEVSDRVSDKVWFRVRMECEGFFREACACENHNSIDTGVNTGGDVSGVAVADNNGEVRWGLFFKEDKVNGVGVRFADNDRWR